MARFFEASSQEVLSFVLIKLPLQEDRMGAPWGSLKEVSPGSSSFVGLTLTISMAGNTPDHGEKGSVFLGWWGSCLLSS